MRDLAFQPRRSGRTTQFIESLPDIGEKIYVVAGNMGIAKAIMFNIRAIRGEQFSFKVVLYSIKSLEMLRSIDPTKIFFEHTAYELADVDTLKQIYEIEDRAKLWESL